MKSTFSDEKELAEIEARFRAAGMVSFADVDTAVTNGPGIYLILTTSGVALKVGISTNLRKRLRQHRRSRDSGLKLKVGGNPNQPDDWISKSSILAKHLYFDRGLVTEYKLTTEGGRRSFLDEECKITYLSTASREEARKLEVVLERTGVFRYCGTVKVR